MPNIELCPRWEYRAQASANNYVILDTNRWVAAIQFNGEFLEAKQDEYASMMAKAPELYQACQAWLDDELDDGEFCDKLRLTIARIKRGAA